MAPEAVLSRPRVDAPRVPSPADVLQRNLHDSRKVTNQIAQLVFDPTQARSGSASTFHDLEVPMPLLPGNPSLQFTVSYRGRPKESISDATNWTDEDVLQLRVQVEGAQKPDFVAMTRLGTGKISHVSDLAVPNSDMSGAKLLRLDAARTVKYLQTAIPSYRALAAYQKGESPELAFIEQVVSQKASVTINGVLESEGKRDLVLPDGRSAQISLTNRFKLTEADQFLTEGADTDQLTVRIRPTDNQPGLTFKFRPTTQRLFGVNIIQQKLLAKINSDNILENPLQAMIAAEEALDAINAVLRPPEPVRIRRARPIHPEFSAYEPHWHPSIESVEPQQESPHDL